MLAKQPTNYPFSQKGDESPFLSKKENSKNLGTRAINQNRRCSARALMRNKHKKNMKSGTRTITQAYYGA